MAFAVLGGIFSGMFLLRPQVVEISSGTLLKTPRVIEPFVLTSATGAPFTNADLAHHWTLVFAGFTFCPDVCPTTLAELKAVQARLGDDAAKVRILFLSVDPGRDTPEKIASYLKFFSPDFLGATGDDAALETLGKNLGYVYAKVPGATPNSYTVDHSTALILINPQGQVAGYLTPPFKPDAMAADLRKLVAQSN
ncbi:SCO family protein [Nevskia ramosa]|uniref:SCO family protein n=1 Tax=Nevskia ramosa TaxID=64002 RepID=UPI002354BAA6